MRMVFLLRIDRLECTIGNAQRCIVLPSVVVRIVFPGLVPMRVTVRERGQRRNERCRKRELQGEKARQGGPGHGSNVA
jgi:hypothetical protein